MATTTQSANSLERVAGEELSEWLEGFEARLDPAGWAMYDAFAARYDLASAVIALRKKQQLTQVELAKRAQVHQSDISRLERGIGNVSQNSLQRIAAALGARLSLVPEPRPAYHAMRTSHQVYERKHQALRSNYLVAPNAFAIRPKRIGIKCQQLRANAAVFERRGEAGLG